MENWWTFTILGAFLFLASPSKGEFQKLPIFPEEFSHYVHVTLETNRENGLEDYRFVLHEGKPQPGKKAVGWAAFSKNDTDVGWSFLRIKTDPKFNDTAQVYAAGLMEGHLTKELIKNYRKNTMGDFCAGQTQYCKKLNDTIVSNLRFLNGYLKHRDTEPYWHQIGLILEQLR